MSDFVINLLSVVDDTLILAGVSLLCGLFLAIWIALASLSRFSILKNLATGYVYLFRSTPLLVQIFLIYYGCGQFREVLSDLGLWQFFKNAWFCAILALTLNTASYTTEIIRGGIQAVPAGQKEAAMALGMTKFVLFKNIIFPIAIRQALPAYGNEIVLMVKATSLASTITIVEMMAVAKEEISQSFQTIPVFAITGAVYLLINFILTRMVNRYENYLNPKKSLA